jgi:hypothetical protein
VDEERLILFSDMINREETLQALREKVIRVCKEYGPTRLVVVTSARGFTPQLLQELIPEAVEIFFVNDDRAVVGLCQETTAGLIAEVKNGVEMKGCTFVVQACSFHASFHVSLAQLLEEVQPCWRNSATRQFHKSSYLLATVGTIGDIMFNIADFAGTRFLSHTCGAMWAMLKRRHACYTVTHKNMDAILENVECSVMGNFLEVQRYRLPVGYFDELNTSPLPPKVHVPKRDGLFLDISRVVYKPDAPWP